MRIAGFSLGGAKEGLPQEVDMWDGLPMVVATIFTLIAIHFINLVWLIIIAAIIDFCLSILKYAVVSSYKFIYYSFGHAIVLWIWSIGTLIYYIIVKPWWLGAYAFAYFIFLGAIVDLPGMIIVDGIATKILGRNHKYYAAERFSHKIENSMAIVNTKKKKRDYLIRLNEWDTFFANFQNITKTIDWDVGTLENKYLEADKIKEYEKAKTFLNVAIDKLKGEIKTLSKIYVPEIAKDYHSDALNHYEKNMQLYSYDLLLHFTDNFEYKITFTDDKMKNLMKEAQDAYVKTHEELARIENVFNQEAEELGLQKPFHNL